MRKDDGITLEEVYNWMLNAMSKNIDKIEWLKHTFCNLHLDIMIQSFVANNFLLILESEHCKIGLIVENWVTQKRSSCSMTVMLLKIMKALNIFSAVCCYLEQSSWSILFWNIMSSKAPMELKTESIIKTLRMNISRKSWNDVLHESLMGTRKRIL